MILLTAHRRENLGKPMENMFKAIRRIVEEFDGVQVVYPVHLNPAVREAAAKHFGDLNKVHLIEPLEVIDFHNFAAEGSLHPHRLWRGAGRSAVARKAGPRASRYDGTARRRPGRDA